MHRDTDQWTTLLHQGQLDTQLRQLYGAGEGVIGVQRKRYEELILTHHKHFPHSGYIRLFSTPGRTELAGNHTDHNHGKVIAASVNLDAIAAVSATADEKVRFYSVDLDQEFEVDLGFLDVHPGEKGTTNALIRGVAAWFAANNKKIGGFNATVQSQVLQGSGLSSSACIEVLLATVFDCLFNDLSTNPVDRAICGKYAENDYFGKPSGLMDQMACSVGGIIGIDFSQPDQPRITRITADFHSAGYQLAIIDTKSDHVGGDDQYASIPLEMKQVAQQIGASVLGDGDPALFWERFSQLRALLPGRALARAAHFFQENARVDHMIKYLQTKPADIPSWLAMVSQSGNSSFKYLQNVIDDPVHQDYALALMAADSFPSSHGKVVHRVHGGGFGGTIQVYVPLEEWDKFVHWMDGLIAPGCVIPLEIRDYGSIEVTAG